MKFGQVGARKEVSPIGSVSVGSGATVVSNPGHLRVKAVRLQSVPSNTSIQWTDVAAASEPTYNPDSWFDIGDPTKLIKNVSVFAGENIDIDTVIAIQNVSGSVPASTQASRSHYMWLKTNQTATEIAGLSANMPGTAYQTPLEGVDAYEVIFNGQLFILQDCTLTLEIQFTTEYTDPHWINFGRATVTRF